MLFAFDFKLIFSLGYLEDISQDFDEHKYTISWNYRQ